MAVAVSGDTVVVGAHGKAAAPPGWTANQSDNWATDSGAAYVFTRSGTTWSQQAYLKASNTEADDYFGSCVAVSGDTVVVGAYGEDSSATGVDGDQSDNQASRAGAAYVFARSGATWSQQAYLKASNTEADDDFGYLGGRLRRHGGGRGVSEDSSATGVDGNQSDNSADDSGAAYVFTRSGATWSQQAYLKASNTEADDYFGRAVAISGDTVVVGATGKTAAPPGWTATRATTFSRDSGAAYVFTRSGRPGASRPTSRPPIRRRMTTLAKQWPSLATRWWSGRTAEDSSATGVDGDQSDNSASASGAAYVFRSDGLYEHIVYLPFVVHVHQSQTRCA